ncbi:hypothetical protein MRX96_042259 [Rhipicephalus microplus]
MGGPPDQLMEEDEDEDVVAAAAEEDGEYDERAVALDEFDEDGRSDSLGSDALAHSPNGNASHHGNYAPADRLLGSRHTDSEDSDACGPGSPAENLTTMASMVSPVAHQPHRRRQQPPHQHHAQQRTPQAPPPPLLPSTSSEGGRPKKSMDDVLKRLTSKMHTIATLNDGASSRAPVEHRSRGGSSGADADHGGRRRVTLQLEGETLRLALSGGSLRDNERRLTEMINQLQQLRDQLLVQQRLQMRLGDLAARKDSGETVDVGGHEIGLPTPRTRRIGGRRPSIIDEAVPASKSRVGATSSVLLRSERQPQVGRQ